MSNIKCGKCHADITLNAAECPACGAPVSPPPTSSERPPRRSVPLGMAFAVLALVTLLVAFLYVRNDGDVAPAERPKPAVDIQSIRAKAEQGDARAQNALGELYAKGEGVKMSYGEAAQWYRKAADQGLAEAQNNMATLYEVGQGVALDESEALKWYLKSAGQGNVDAQYSVALMYATGRGGPKDKEASVKWFKEAALQGLPLAQFNLAQRYEHGQGVAASPLEACIWFSLAAKEITDAVRFRDEMKSKLSPEQISEVQRRVAAFVPRKATPTPAK